MTALHEAQQNSNSAQVENGCNCFGPMSNLQVLNRADNVWHFLHGGIGKIDHRACTTSDHLD
jgi:hypothetical protein